MTTVKLQARVFGVCGRCSRRRPDRQPNTMVLVDYLTTRTVVAQVMRRGNPNGPVTPPPYNDSRARFYPISPGKGATLECPDCLARPRRSRKQLLAQADKARAADRPYFAVAD